MARTARHVRTWRAMMLDGHLRHLALDPRPTLRWAAVWGSRPGRGVGPLRRAPRATCVACSSPAPLVVGAGYDELGRPAEQLPACRRHVDELALARLAATRSRVSSYPARTTWRVWWRSAPLAVAWRNAAAQTRRSSVALLPVTMTAPPRGSGLFRERPSMW